jgi:hypothetical protein
MGRSPAEGAECSLAKNSGFSHGPGELPKLSKNNPISRIYSQIHAPVRQVFSISDDLQVVKNPTRHQPTE